MELVASEADDEIVRDDKKDKIADVRAKRKTDGGKFQPYCTLDSPDLLSAHGFRGGSASGDQRHKAPRRSMIPPGFVRFYDEKELHKPYCFECVHFATEKGNSR